MNLQGNGNNHNHRPKLNDDNDSFISFAQGEDYEKITGMKPVSVSEDGSAQFGSDEERAKKLQEAKEMENSSAYDDLDDFIYRQNKKRHRGEGGRHHRHHRTSPSVLSPSHKRRRSSSSKKHKHKHHFHRHHHSRRRLRRWQKVSIAIISVILGLIAAGIISIVALFFIGKGQLTNKGDFNINVPKYAESTDNGNYITYKGKKYQFNDNVTSILCMGIDTQEEPKGKTEYGSGGAADSIFLLSLDLSSGRSTMLNISRDTYTEIGIYSADTGVYIGEKKSQLALAYAYGDGKETSCHNEVVAVRELLYNVPINSYLALYLNGIGPINDSVGGVSVTSPETIDHFKAGQTYLLKGNMAQSFVRARSHATIEGNNLRMQRQKAYLESFASTLVTQTRSNLSTPVTIFNEASPYICTDINASKVAYFAVNAIQGNFADFEIMNVPGTMKEGEPYPEFHVNDKKLFEQILDIFYLPVKD